MNTHTHSPMHTHTYWPYTCPKPETIYVAKDIRQSIKGRKNNTVKKVRPNIITINL